MTKTQKQSPSTGRAKRSVRILWAAFFIGIASLALLVIMLNSGWLGYMPSMYELENPSSALSSDVYAADGTLIGRYYVQDRSNSKYTEISPNVFNALLATEDARFFEHSGIDPIGTVAIPFYIMTGKKRGSSTITQQLAKNLFHRKNENVFTLPFIKLKEWIMAVKLERNLTKSEIITLYLNTVPYSDNVYGIKNASMTFYNKTPDKLNIEEAAVLIGMLKGNTLYNPRRHLAKATERRNVVLDQMAKYNYISNRQDEDLSKQPIKLDYHKQDYHEGIAPYFRQVVEAQVKLLCKDLKKPDGTPYDLYKDGLKIYTTLDIKMQHYAEEAVQEHMSDVQKLFVAQAAYKDGSIWNAPEVKTILKAAIANCDRYQMLKDDDMTDEQALREMAKPIKMRVFAWNDVHYKDTVMSPIDSIKYMKVFLQAGFMAMDPFTGEVKAWVGGIDHTFFQYDHVNINTKRQVGSTIKPLLYCLAVDNGFSPCGTVSTAPQSFPGYMNHPYDAGGSEHGDVTMKYALALSLNNAALYILKQVGIPAFVDFVHKCGISNIDKYPASALGVSDISLYEMLGAYSMFPSGGINTQPYYITKIEDKNGTLLKNFTPIQKEIINAGTAYRMVNLMRGVVDFGTGKRMRYRYGIKSDIAGKTGTTNNQADAWFIGYTPQLIAGTWVGCDDRVFRFKSEALGQGSAAALPVWAYFIKRVYADRSLGISPEATFKVPSGYNDCDVTDPTSGARSSTYYSNGLVPNSKDTSDPIETAPPENE
ncbi:MAG: transglycosylase domain-containing protein [Flavipsychrobacter sp.]|nr:transglycosylase domain-containing protein [Flavipsychrobacter sp.]